MGVQFECSRCGLSVRCDYFVKKGEYVPSTNKRLRFHEDAFCLRDPFTESTVTTSSTTTSRANPADADASRSSNNNNNNVNNAIQGGPGIIFVGGVCSVCQRNVCASPECSIFYTARFCIDCANKYKEHFPPAVLSSAAAAAAK